MSYEQRALEKIQMASSEHFVNFPLAGIPLFFSKGNVVLRQVVKIYFHLNHVVYHLHSNRLASFQFLSSVKIPESYFSLVWDEFDGKL